VYCGQPSTSVHPFWPVSFSPGASALFFQGVAHALHAFVVVRRRGAARLDADRPPLGLRLHHELRQIDANVIIVRADVSGAQALVFLEKIRVPGDDRNVGGLGALQRGRDRRGVGRRDRDPVDFLRDEIADDLGLLIAAAVLVRADVKAFDRPLQLGLGLFAASQGLVIKRIVGALGYEREGVGIGRPCSR
jgi:hypothetical protein